MPNTQITATKDQRYPFQTSIVIDPADYDRLARRIDARRGLKIGRVDDDIGHEWTVTITCASHRMAEDLLGWEI